MDRASDSYSDGCGDDYNYKESSNFCGETLPFWHLTINKQRLHLLHMDLQVLILVYFLPLLYCMQPFIS